MVFIYLIQSKGGLKIGVSEEPFRRLSQLSIGNPHSMKMVEFVRGGFGEEAELHRLFKFLHVRGEWFKEHKLIFQTFRHAREYGIEGALEFASHQVHLMKKESKSQHAKAAIEFDPWLEACVALSMYSRGYDWGSIHTKLMDRNAKGAGFIKKLKKRINLPKDQLFEWVAQFSQCRKIQQHQKSGWI